MYKVLFKKEKLNPNITLTYRFFSVNIKALDQGIPEFLLEKCSFFEITKNVSLFVSSFVSILTPHLSQLEKSTFSLGLLLSVIYTI